jgi:tellurite resistance protein TerC
MKSELVFISGFVIFILIVLAIDLGLFTSTTKPVSLKRAALMSGIWLVLALGFYCLLLKEGHLLHHIDSFQTLKQVNEQNSHHLALNAANFPQSLQAYRKNLALEFISGYVVEYALSIDNIIVMVMIFAAFGVSENHYRKVLLWGIIGAIIMRFCFIFPGAAICT